MIDWEKITLKLMKSHLLEKITDSHLKMEVEYA